ncbi:hypothetical protein SANTM175S_05816 [Streptomyces antimycoticus]
MPRRADVPGRRSAGQGVQRSGVRVLRRWSCPGSVSDVRWRTRTRTAAAVSDHREHVPAVPPTGCCSVTSHAGRASAWAATEGGPWYWSSARAPGRSSLIPDSLTVDVPDLLRPARVARRGRRRYPQLGSPTEGAAPGCGRTPWHGRVVGPRALGRPGGGMGAFDELVRLPTPHRCRGVRVQPYLIAGRASAAGAAAPLGTPDRPGRAPGSWSLRSWRSSAVIWWRRARIAASVSRSVIGSSGEASAYAFVTPR